MTVFKFTKKFRQTEPSGRQIYITVGVCKFDLLKKGRNVKIISTFTGN